MAGAERQGALYPLHLRSICSLTSPDLGHTVPANPSGAFVVTYLDNYNLHPFHLGLPYVPVIDCILNSGRGWI